MERSEAHETFFRYGRLVTAEKRSEDGHAAADYTSVKFRGAGREGKRVRSLDLKTRLGTD